MDLPPSVHDADEVRAAADRILADPRYDVPPKSIPDRILEWFGEQIASVIGSLVGGGAGAVIAWGFVIAAVAFVVVLLVRFGRLPRLARPASAASPEVMVELTRSPREWRADADALAAQGRWREAVRSLHRALVADLVRSGALSDQPGRTARELVRDLAAERPDAVDPFAAATSIFEGAWYGHAPVGQSDVDRMRALDADVLRPRVGSR